MTELTRIPSPCVRPDSVLARFAQRSLPDSKLGLADALGARPPAPPALETRVERITLPREVWNAIDAGQLVYTDLRRIY